ncbi:MAG: aldo/keto reductase, partial [Verrucomicrobiota bacterium]
MTSPLLPSSNIGLGCVTFGREIDEAGAFAMMDHAVAQGITFFDTAAAYGGGASETIVGKWLALRGTRDRVVLATKLLPPFTPAAIEASVNTSLQRLGVSHLDLLFLHRWDATAETEPALRALDHLVKTGRVRGIAASN